VLSWSWPIRLVLIQKSTDEYQKLHSGLFFNGHNGTYVVSQSALKDSQ